MQTNVKKYQHTKRQHYVPSFYLESFSDDEQVYVLSVNDRRIYKQNIRDVCVKNDLYETRWGESEGKNGKYVLDNNVEQYLSKVENQASIVLKRIIKELNGGAKSLDLSIVEKNTLIELVSTQYLRTPYMIKDTKQYYSGVEVYSEMRNLSDSIYKFFDENDLGNPAPLIQHSIVIGMFNKELEGSPLNVIYKEFFSMKIVFWRSKYPFVTASFPLLIDADDYVAHRIVFPIDSNNAMVLFDARTPFLKEGIVLDVLPSISCDINRKYMKKYKKGLVEFLIANERKTLESLL